MFADREPECGKQTGLHRDMVVSGVVDSGTREGTNDRLTDVGLLLFAEEKPPTRLDRFLMFFGLPRLSPATTTWTGVSAYKEGGIFTASRDL